MIDFHDTIIKHGSPYDRGGADSYYRRPANPHYYPQGSYNGEVITDLTDEQIAEYYRGYEDNERAGNFKDWEQIMRLNKKQKQTRQMCWDLMYNLALEEPDYLKGMIVTITDSWDAEQFEITQEHMLKSWFLRHIEEQA